MISAPVRSLHVDLEEPLEGLDPLPGAGGAHVVFWLATTPLGEVYLHPSELPLSAVQLATLAANSTADTVLHRLAHGACAPPPLEPQRAGSDQRPPARPLEALRGQLQAASEGVHELAPRSAIVIATRDRPAVLDRCLAAIERLHDPPDEVLVVDNSGSGSAGDLCRRRGVRHLHAPAGGLAAARNAGLAATTQPFLAFTDDDVEVHPGWLGSVLAPFTDEDVASVTGLVLPAELATDAQLVFERHLRYLNKGFRPIRYDHSFLGAGPLAAPVWRIGAGANLALRRRAVEAVGGFDERLGAGAAGCAEDSELWFRLLRARWTCRYEPAAVVFHHHRRTLTEAARQSRAYLRGHTAGLAVQYASAGGAEHLDRAVIRLPRELAREAAGDLVGGAVRRRLWAARALGYAAGLGLLVNVLAGRSRRDRP